MVKMSKQNKNQPKMLPNVLQAIAELKETRGSTTKKIIERVQKGVNNSKARPKPRNVVMQVKRAIKHAVSAGVINQKSGRYKLVNMSKSSKNDSKKSSKPLKKAPSDNIKSKGYRRAPERKKYKPRRRRQSYSTVPSETSRTTSARSYASSYSEASSYSSYYEPRKSAPKPKRKQKPRSRRQINTSKQENNNDSNQFEMPNDELNMNLNSNMKRSNQRMTNDDQDYETVGQYILDESAGNECDNPDCICNLKQEPLDEMQVQYDDELNCTDYLN